LARARHRLIKRIGYTKYFENVQKQNENNNYNLC
jgi:dissimilatory sulfite reductase (desulfoviridin) alpha/beta subunit